MTDDRRHPDPSGLPFLPRVDPGLAAAAGSGVTAEAFAGFLTDGDEEVARWALRRALAGRERAEVYDSFVRDAMRLVGERWLAGRWTISEEHLASRTLARVVASVAPPESPADRLGPPAVLAGVAGEEHSIGLLLLAHILQEAGFVVSDLGADVPADDLVRFAAKTEARLVALAASTAAREETIRDAVAALQALPDAPAIIVGGRIAELVDLEGLGVEWVGSSLVEASRVARALAGRLSRPAEG